MSRDARSCFGTWKGWLGPICRLRGARMAGEGSERRYMEGEAALDGGSGGFHGALAGDGRPGSDVVCGAYAARRALSARLNQCLVTTEILSRLFRRRPISISESL